MATNSPLFEVVTIPEAAMMYNKHPATIRQAITTRRKPLCARQTGRVYLITLASLIRRYGPPLNTLDTYIDNPS